MGSMFLSITISRFVLIVFQFYIMIQHLESLRKAYSDPKLQGKVNFRKILRLWNIYFVIKIFIFIMLLTGTFILSEWIRGILGMDNDALDFEILNYLGIENLDKKTINDFPNLVNCMPTVIKPMQHDITEKLFRTFVAEGLMFIMIRTALKILRIKMNYYENLYLAMKKSPKEALAKVKMNQDLYKILKIFHNYIKPRRDSSKNSKFRTIDRLIMFVARIYTTIIYALILFFSLSSGKICIIVFVYLGFFFRYFLRINGTFLDYLAKEDVERVVEWSK